MTYVSSGTLNYIHYSLSLFILDEWSGEYMSHVIVR